MRCVQGDVGVSDSVQDVDRSGMIGLPYRPARSAVKPVPSTYPKEVCKGYDLRGIGSVDQPHRRTSTARHVVQRLGGDAFGPGRQAPVGVLAQTPSAGEGLGEVFGHHNSGFVYDRMYCFESDITHMALPRGRSAIPLDGTEVVITNQLCLGQVTALLGLVSQGAELGAAGVLCPAVIGFRGEQCAQFGAVVHTVGVGEHFGVTLIDTQPCGATGTLRRLHGVGIDHIVDLDPPASQKQSQSPGRSDRRVERD